MPVTKVTQPQSVLPNSNQLVQTMPSQPQTSQPPTIHAVSLQSSISRLPPLKPANRQLQPHPPACTQIPSSQQGAFPFALINNQGSSYSVDSAHEPHLTSVHNIPSSVTAPLSGIPARPKPAPGLFMFGRLTFLDKKVSRCYGCGESLKPGGLTPHPPDDLVVTTRLHRQYYHEGKLQTSPRISSMYFHLNQDCVRASCPSFALTSCQVPQDLVPWLFVQHKNALLQRFGIAFN